MAAIDTARADPATAARRSERGGSRRFGRARLHDGLVVGIPTLLTVVLCLYELRTRSLWLDEAATVAIASQHGAAFGAALARDGGNMLGYYALLHVLIGWFGASTLVIRLPSVIFAAATVAATTTLALRLFRREVAALTGLLSVLSLSLVYWGQDARGYAAMIAFVAASFLAFAALLDLGAKWRWWWAYVVLTTAAVYAGLEAALVIPAQCVVLLWRRDARRPVLGAMGAVIGCCVPLAVLAAGRGSGQLFWVPPPSLHVLRQITQALTSAGLQPNFYTATGTALLILSLAILVPGVSRALWLARRTGGGSVHGVLLSVSWLLVPGIVAAIESAFGQSIFEPRYLLISLPAVSLVLAWTLLDRRSARILFLVGAGALLVLRALQLAPAYGISSENWRGAAAYVISHGQPRDCIAFYPLDNRQAFRYYVTSPALAPQPILPAVPWTRIRPFVEDYSTLSASEIDRLPSRCRRVWLVASHEGRVGGPPVSRANYNRFAALTGDLRRLYPHASSGNFGAQGVVTVTLYAG